MKKALMAAAAGLAVIILLLSGCNADDGKNKGSENITVEEAVSENTSEAGTQSDSGEKTEENTEPDEFGYKKRSVTMKVSNGYLVSDDDTPILYTILNYPEIKNPDNLRGINEINTMYSMMDKQVAKSYSNTEMANRANEAYKRLGNKFVPFSAQCSITVTYNKGNIISLRVEREEFEEEREGRYARKGDNRFLDTNADILLTDIFNAEEEEIREKVEEGLDEIIDGSPEKYYDDAKSMTDEAAKNASWYISEEGIVFAVGPEIIAPYETGCIEYVIKYNDNKELFKEGIFA